MNFEPWPPKNYSEPKIETSRSNNRIPPNFQNPRNLSRKKNGTQTMEPKNDPTKNQTTKQVNHQCPNKKLTALDNTSPENWKDTENIT